MSKVIIDAREYVMTPPISGANLRGTEILLRKIATALASAGHRVHVVTAERQEYDIDGVQWWPASYFPRQCDVLIACERLDRIGDFQYGRLLVTLNRIDPTLAGNEAKVERFICLSENHVEALRKVCPTIRPDQCAVIGPGTEIPPVEFGLKVPNRLVWCNSPDRGLIHIARMWPALVKRIPDVTLAVTYDFDSYLKALWYVADNEATEALEIKRWMEENPATVLNMGNLPREAVLREMGRGHLYPYPCDPPMPGSIVHAFAVLEACAMGCLPILSKADGLPSVFSEAAKFVDTPTDYDAWVEAIAELLADPMQLHALQKQARKWAKGHTWERHGSQWRDMVAQRKEVAVG